MKPKLGVLLALTCVLLVFSNIGQTFANIPTVTSVVAWTRQSDNHTVLNITVVHTGYFSGHYVDWVKVNISDAVQMINMTDSSPVDQTIGSTLVVPYDMGMLSDAPTVQTQANCNAHGSSSWSPVLTVPELSSLQLCIVLVALAVFTFFFSTRIQSKGESRVLIG